MSALPSHCRECRVSSTPEKAQCDPTAKLGIPTKLRRQAKRKPDNETRQSGVGNEGSTDCAEREAASPALLIDERVFAKARVEACLSIDIVQWRREWRNCPFHAGRWEWHHSGTGRVVSGIDYSINFFDPHVRLQYTLTEPRERLDYRVDLARWKEGHQHNRWLD